MSPQELKLAKKFGEIGKSLVVTPDMKFIKVLKYHPWLETGEWHVSVEMPDGYTMTLFDVADDQEANYFVQHPQKIVDEVERIRRVMNRQASVYGGNPSLHGVEEDQEESPALKPSDNLWGSLKPAQKTVRPKQEKKAIGDMSSEIADAVTKSAARDGAK